MPRTELRARGDVDLAERLLGERVIARAIETVEKHADELGSRRRLLGTALRLTREMAPSIYGVIDACMGALDMDAPLEAYVYPGPMFNAAAVRPERGRLLMLLSSSLLEAFDDAELRFVIGHELGHHMFDHHRIPVGILLAGGAPVGAGLALQLFAWQRWAEISCDRAGIVCAGELEPAARALFKLASGLRTDRVQIRIDHFMSQVRDLQDETNQQARADEPARSDWFATHPFSPLRLRAAELFADSAQMRAGGTELDDLEARVQELMGIMSPSYLQERTDAAEAMRRLLFAGGVLIAAAGDGLSGPTVKALEELLGPGSVSSRVDPEAVRADLPSRIERVKAVVPRLRRVQVLRDLCVLTRADGHVSEAERELLHEIATGIEVDPCIVPSTIDDAASGDEAAGRTSHFRIREDR